MSAVCWLLTQCIDRFIIMLQIFFNLIGIKWERLHDFVQYLGVGMKLEGLYFL